MFSCLYILNRTSTSIWRWRQWNKRTQKRKWWEIGCKNYMPSSPTCLTTKRRPDDDLAGDVRRVFTKGGRNSFVEFFFFHIMFLFEFGRKGHGLEGGKIMYLFLLPNKRKIFLYHNTHDFPTLFSFVYCLSRRREEKSIVNEPSANGWWNFIVIFSVHTLWLFVVCARE